MSTYNNFVAYMETSVLSPSHPLRQVDAWIGTTVEDCRENLNGTTLLFPGVNANGEQVGDGGDAADLALYQALYDWVKAGNPHLAEMFVAAERQGETLVLDNHKQL